MAWVTPFTAVTGTLYTAAQANQLRDNLLETLVAKVTAAGQVGVSTGPNALAARGIASSQVAGGSQTTNTGAFGDLITAGPSVTLTTGSVVKVTLTAFIANSTAGAGGYMVYRISGANNINPTAERSLRLMSDVASSRNRASAVIYQSGLTAGVNTFKAEYATVGGGVADFDERVVFVEPLS